MTDLSKLARSSSQTDQYSYPYYTTRFTTMADAAAKDTSGKTGAEEKKTDTETKAEIAPVPVKVEDGQSVFLGSM